MITGLNTSGVKCYFYENPIPLIIGNLPYNYPLGSLNDYNYKKIYTIFGNAEGILHYSEFFNNYEILLNKPKVDELYPKIILTNENDYSSGQKFVLNPFFNDENGICSYIAEFNTANNSKLFYNTDIDKFEWSFGQSFPYHEGYGFSINARDLKNTNYEYGSYYSEDELKNSSFATTVKFVNNDDTFNFVSLNENSPGNEGTLTSFNQDHSAYANVKIRIEDKDYILRTDIIPDLDYEDDMLNVEKILGAYQNKNGSTYIIGSWVLGNDEDNVGRFIGINRDYSTPESNVGDEPYPLNCFKITQDGFEKKLRLDESCYVWYGSTYDLEIPRHIVRIRSKNLNEPYIVNRYFILEGYSKNPLDYDKFWYLDFENASSTSINSPAELFNYPMRFNSKSFEKLTFKWYNKIDDEVRNDLEIYPIGLTRRNPLKIMFGRNSSLGINSNTSSPFKPRFNYNTFIANWIAPNTQIIKEDENA